MVKQSEVIKIGELYFNKEQLYATLKVRCDTYQESDIEPDVIM